MIEKKIQFAEKKIKENEGQINNNDNLLINLTKTPSDKTLINDMIIRYGKIKIKPNDEINSLKAEIKKLKIEKLEGEIETYSNELETQFKKSLKEDSTQNIVELQKLTNKVREKVDELEKLTSQQSQL